MPSLETYDSSFRRKIREKLRKTFHRPRARKSLESAPQGGDLEAQVGKTTTAIEPDSAFEITTNVPNLRSSSAGRSFPETKLPKRGVSTQLPANINSSSVASQNPASERGSHIEHRNYDVDENAVVRSSDLWSAAYGEAVDGFGKGVDKAILKGENVAILFKQLEEIDKEAREESCFLRGVKYLHSLQVPLNNFKLALDLAAPLTSIEPTVGTVFGIVKSVTAIAISVSTADQEFARQIAEMLAQISYIDDCDILGQKTEKKDIHEVLVSVYRKLLEFYYAAFDILTRKGTRLVMTMVLENDRLPGIVKEFLKHTSKLHILVQKATFEIVAEIETLLLDGKILGWLGRDKMARQGHQHESLQVLRADEACEFLLAEPNFISWYHASSSQQLAIIGDMGHGKSVAMAFLIDEIRRRCLQQLPQPKICYHYCQNNETGEARYIFSALILSLLDQFRGMKKDFAARYSSATSIGNFEPAYSVKKSAEYLQQIMERVDRPVFMFIDGLDECDRSSRNALLDLLRTLSQKASRLKIIVSSRPQEGILEQLNGMAHIDLSSDAKRDRIVAEKAVNEQLAGLSHDVRAFVVERLSVLASGSLIWIKMMVEFISARGIRALGPMRIFFKEEPHPGKLSELYVKLLKQLTLEDPVNWRLAFTALQILATSRRPLSIQELAWGTTLGAAPEEFATVASLEEAVDPLSTINLIHPFTAHVDYKDLKKRQIRLTHQSVKEFIIRHVASELLGQEVSDMTAMKPKSYTSSSLQCLEKNMLTICTKYLLMEQFQHIDLFSEEQKAIEVLPQEDNLFDDDNKPNLYDHYCTWEVWEEPMIHYDPIERGFGEFFVYASCHWLDHFGAIVTGPLPSLRVLETLCRANSTRLENWMEQYRRPGCALQPRFPLDWKFHDPLTITSLYGSKAMLQEMLERADFNDGSFLPNTPMKAAEQIFREGDLSILNLFFSDVRVGPQFRTFEFFHFLMKQWVLFHGPGRDWEQVFDLVDIAKDAMIQEHWGHKLLCAANDMGCEPIARRLLNIAQRDTELKNELKDDAHSLT